MVRREKEKNNNKKNQVWEYYLEGFKIKNKGKEYNLIKIKIYDIFLVTLNGLFAD